MSGRNLASLVQQTCLVKECFKDLINLANTTDIWQETSPQTHLLATFLPQFLLDRHDEHLRLVGEILRLLDHLLVRRLGIRSHDNVTLPAYKTMLCDNGNPLNLTWTGMVFSIYPQQLLASMCKVKY